MTGSWLIGPTNQGPADPIIPTCEDCRVSLEDGDGAVHALDCAIEYERVNAERDCDGSHWWQASCPNCGDVAEPEGAGVACECGSFMHGRC